MKTACRTHGMCTIYEIKQPQERLDLARGCTCSDAVLDRICPVGAPVLTRGTYDDARGAKGERPGTFKKGDYRVADDVGAAPEEVPGLVKALAAEVQEALLSESAEKNALTIAAYLHAQLVDIHPFADGNGRTARLLMNYVLLKLNGAPCTISADDRLAYFGALDAFHQEGELVPFIDFCRIQTLKTWEQLL
ncbi:MAG: Fic family protein [Adlercreutzia equolifaciens]